MGRNCENFITSYCEAARFSEAPAIFHKWAAIALISAALQRKCFVDWGVGEGFFPNLYIALVGKSGFGKDTALKEVESLLQGTEIVRLLPQSATREAFFVELCDPTDTISGEDMADGLPTHCSATLIHEELSVFLCPKDDQGRFLQELCRLWDCPKYSSYSTIKRGKAEIHNAYLTILGAITPGRIHIAMPRDQGEEGGLASRFFFVWGGNPENLVVFPKMRRNLQTLRDGLRADLTAISRLRGEFGYSKEFMQRYEQWYTQDEDGYKFPNNSKIGTLIPGFHSRTRPHLLKLSMIHAAARATLNPARMVMRKEDMVWALDTLKEVAAVMPNCFRTVSYGKWALLREEIIQYVTEMGGRRIPQVNIRNRFLAMADNGQVVDQCLKGLVDAAFLVLETLPNPKKPKESRNYYSLPPVDEAYIQRLRDELSNRPVLSVQTYAEAHQAKDGKEELPLYAEEEGVQEEWRE